LEWLVYILAGALAGIVRTVIEGKGIIILPHVVERDRVKMFNLGFLSAAVIGGLAGFIAPYGYGADTLMAALAGFAGSHVIEHLAERKLKLPAA